MLPFLLGEVKPFALPTSFSFDSCSLIYPLIIYLSIYPLMSSSIRPSSILPFIRSFFSFLTNLHLSGLCCCLSSQPPKPGSLGCSGSSGLRALTPDSALFSGSSDILHSGPEPGTAPRPVVIARSCWGEGQDS